MEYVVGNVKRYDCEIVAQQLGENLNILNSGLLLIAEGSATLNSLSFKLRGLHLVLESAIENKLNHRPRKRLGFKTPHEVFHASLNRVAVRT